MARPHKGQHKVPKTYLQAFAGEDGKLWVVGSDLTVRKSAPSDTLKERDYYTVRFPDGGGSLAIETEFLGGIEGAYAEIYKTKLSQHLTLTATEKARMAIFVASMIERSPRRRDGFESMFDKVREMTDRMQAAMDAMSDDEGQAWGNSQGHFHDEENSIPADEFLAMGEDIGSLHSSQLPDSVEFAAQILFSMNWGFMLRPEGSLPYLTSDSPAVLLNPQLSDTWMGHGLAQQNIEVSLPLSPDISLLAGWELTSDCMYKTVAPALVEQVNERVIRQSDTLVSNQRDMLDQVVANARAAMQVGG